ncbi:hypothetical protein HPP92_015975 [Vanilla planifolia]|uniref:Uncharacterized protein n=1 Tax=Vanilla planifolia TaxID=51239 RepID=A0A835QHS6_VANPL|nr:hypothetical protein HPP92_016559 [Vanilla planifolia]KAG0471429.1 hypothetical protein HPP92_015975 [Vanilla planifolia]
MKVEYPELDLGEASDSSWLMLPSATKSSKLFQGWNSLPVIITPASAPHWRSPALQALIKNGSEKWSECKEGSVGSGKNDLAALSLEVGFEEAVTARAGTEGRIRRASQHVSGFCGGKKEEARNYGFR